MRMLRQENKELRGELRECVAFMRGMVSAPQPSMGDVYQRAHAHLQPDREQDEEPPVPRQQDQPPFPLARVLPQRIWADRAKYKTPTDVWKAYDEGSHGLCAARKVSSLFAFCFFLLLSHLIDSHPLCLLYSSLSYQVLRVSRYSTTHEKSDVKYWSKVKRMLAHLDGLGTRDATGDAIKNELARYDEEFKVYEGTLTTWIKSNDDKNRWAKPTRTWKPKESVFVSPSE